MNESTLLKLKVIVERAVRPVKASLPCKMKMREELSLTKPPSLKMSYVGLGMKQRHSIKWKKRFGGPWVNSFMDGEGRQVL